MCAREFTTLCSNSAFAVGKASFLIIRTMYFPFVIILVRNGNLYVFILHISKLYRLFFFLNIKLGVQ